ncbi:hypothetical protein C1637_05165 [Chryseobacterium lactis]|uniref:DUF3278 domain-containing protein n=1 Tax=Chryseobacterium lactis TaxID=1241981 RepID=A0A3G6RRG3_CHRLC|nr:hypothetical protein [Chryseobacterium lactis]AZA84236.1 hypothetical protein EG342_21135 [Chryseobacterium lactis]AZB04624.1 hypothetical protein EG341_12015 [Chryseobacterium lactis]PNW14355.1 hypothetical protein C1637_05165 [Chryseobacterium lactis]
MELDNFKELWNKDTGQNPPEISLEKQSEIHSPLQMLKVNMKTEFWLMVITLPLLLTSFPFASKDSNIKTIAIFVTILTLAFIVYFYSRFLKLYRLLQRNSINTNYDLSNLKTQLLISKEIYISYYISYIPLAFLLCLISINFHFDMEYNLSIFGVSLLITLLLVCFIIKYWIYFMYGKYIDDIVLLVDELNGIDVKPKPQKRKTWFERSQKFFVNKLGIKGNILNTVIWFISVYIFVILFLTLVLLIIIIIGAKLGFINIITLQQALNRLN